MLYPVNKPFKDMQDKGREYRSNDWYPRFNFDVNDKRIEQLIDLGYIKEQKQEFPIHTGGGWYELSDGERVQGKNNAVKAQKKIGD